MRAQGQETRTVALLLLLYQMLCRNTCCGDTRLAISGLQESAYLNPPSREVTLHGIAEKQGYIRYIQVVKDHDAIAYIPTYAGEIAGLSWQCLFGYHWNKPTQNQARNVLRSRSSLLAERRLERRLGKHGVLMRCLLNETPFIRPYLCFFFYRDTVQGRYHLFIVACAPNSNATNASWRY
jgi:hypothetical protein